MNAKELRQRAEKLYEEAKQIRKEMAKLDELHKESMKKHEEFQKKFQEFQKYFKVGDESKKPCKELLTSFGLIPQMPNRLSACGRCIIAVSPKHGHHAEPRSICMPHQLYVEKLNKLLEEGEVFIFTASKGYKVKKDGKRVWIE